MLQDWLRKKMPTYTEQKRDIDEKRAGDRETEDRVSIERKGIAHSLMEAKERFANRKDRSTL